MYPTQYSVCVFRYMAAVIRGAKLHFEAETSAGSEPLAMNVRLIVSEQRNKVLTT